MQAPRKNSMSQKQVPTLNVPGLGAVPIKYVALLTLVIQNAGVVILMKYSRKLPGDKATMSTIVVMQEILKLFLSLCLVYNESGSLRGLNETINRELLGKPAEAMKLSVPTILYTIQNNCILVGLEYLDAAVFHVLYQSKLVVAAILSVVMLGKSLQSLQWLAVILLTLGVALVQISNGQGKKHESADGAEKTMSEINFGLAAVITAALCSGFAGVYFEKILKGSNTSVWVRNIQLALGGALIGMLITYFQDGEQVANLGFFFGYNWTVWAVIVSNAGGGLLIAIVIKYADNILKGFACSFAIVCSSILSIFMFDFWPGSLFYIGTTLVAVSVYLYTPRPVPAAATLPVSAQAEEVELIAKN
jgi:UDP-sugar transporter A1/2/3